MRWMLLLLLTLATPALAVDGVLEINQTCAVQTGCFAGDGAGFPVTIDGSAGKSYRLTGDLIVPDENTSCIEVRAPEISIDMGGFEIVRSGCEEATIPCTLSGIGYGIRAAFSPGQDFVGTSVANGSITGMGLDGVRLSSTARVTGMRVQWNGGYGIRTFGASAVSDNIVRGNGDDGIFVTNNSDVSRNIVNANGGSGIDAGRGSSVSGNTVCSNGGGTNGGYGLDLEIQGTYRENTVTGNVTGAVNGSGVNLGGNYCAGTGVTLPTCP